MPDTSHHLQQHVVAEVPVGLEGAQVELEPSAEVCEGQLVEELGLREFAGDEVQGGRGLCGVALDGLLHRPLWLGVDLVWNRHAVDLLLLLCGRGYVHPQVVKPDCVGAVPPLQARGQRRAVDGQHHSNPRVKRVGRVGPCRLWVVDAPHRHPLQGLPPVGAEVHLPAVEPRVWLDLVLPQLVALDELRHRVNPVHLNGLLPDLAGLCRLV
mmetsp:Transcript_52166/g.131060  ORF Transcript_52166/g.131060 Transcript_52166/m.131060 type:complete len:211 (+) Transcript_52166:413-1045(+)